VTSELIELCKAADNARWTEALERVKAERDHYLAEWTAELEGGGALRKCLGAQPDETIWQAAERVVASNARLRAALEQYADASNWKRGPARDDDARSWLIEGDGYDVACAALRPAEE
jgi:hypothetical protein